MPPAVQYGGDEVSALVLDVGSYTTRAGYAGEDSPRTVFPTTYASVPSTDSKIYGTTVHLYRPHAIHANPISDGLVTDWDSVSGLMEHAFVNQLRLPKLEDYPLLTTEASWNTKENKEKMMQIAFESWDVPAYYAVDKSVLSSFASGRGTCLLVDIGHQMTTVTPVYDGFVLRKAIQRQPLGGELLSELLLKAIETNQTVPIRPQYQVKSKVHVDINAPSQAVLYDERIPNGAPDCPTTPSYHATEVGRVMHNFKESMLEVYGPVWDDAGAGSRQGKVFEYPDGYSTLYGGLRYAVPEVLFNPTRFLNQEFTTRAIPTPQASIPSHPYSAMLPITQLITNTLALLDPDLHVSLMQNIVVTGGSTLLPGFLDRLQNELASKSGGIKPRIQAPHSLVERLYAPWLGGSILASLGTFHQLWIGKEEYAEIGAQRLVKK